MGSERKSIVIACVAVVLTILLLSAFAFAREYSAESNGGADTTNTPDRRASSTLATQKVWATEWESIKTDFEDVNQKVEFYSGNNSPLLTMTDNEEIFYFTKSLEYEKWDYSMNQIPTEAVNICAFVSYRERNGIMLEDGRNTVYHDANGYYMLSVAANKTELQVKMSDQAALNLLCLLGLDSPNSTTTFGYSSHPSGVNDSVEIEMPFSNFTYEGMLSASKVNRLDIQSGKDVIRSISDNRELYDFLMSLDFSAWVRVDEISEAARQICSILFYQEGRKDYVGTMMEQWRLVVYCDAGKYYLQIIIADNGHGNNINELSPQRFLIPDEVGSMLQNIE